MIASTNAAELLKRTLSIIAVTDEDVVFKGITAEVIDRIVELKKSASILKKKYGSLEQLEQDIEHKGVSPDDHNLYTDLLEWRAMKDELKNLVKILESL